MHFSIEGDGLNKKRVQSAIAEEMWRNRLTIDALLEIIQRIHKLDEEAMQDIWDNIMELVNKEQDKGDETHLHTDDYDTEVYEAKIEAEAAKEDFEKDAINQENKEEIDEKPLTNEEKSGILVSKKLYDITDLLLELDPKGGEF